MVFVFIRPFYGQFKWSERQGDNIVNGSSILAGFPLIPRQPGLVCLGLHRHRRQHLRLVPAIVLDQVHLEEIQHLPGEGGALSD
jgi:hypothetical protein